MFFKGLLNKKDKIFKKFIGTPIGWRENTIVNGRVRFAMYRCRFVGCSFLFYRLLPI